MCYDDDFVTCRFVSGKSRVTPLRPVTIPGLELTAAVLAAKLGSVVCKELQYSFERVVFWSDATVVLRYINSYFKMFTANRTETIYTLSSAHEWRYVPTDLNPADIASRGLTPDNIDAAKSWLHGPEFLLEDERQWPEQPDFLVQEKNDPERRQVKVFSVRLDATEPDSLYRLLRRSSSFTVLQTSVA